MMSLNLLTLAAQTPQQGGGPKEMLMSLAPFILIFGIMYFLLIRPQQKKQKEHEAMLSRVKAGDRVLTNGGMYGTVTAVTEKTLQVRVADNVVVELARGAVTAVVDTNETAPKA